MLKSDFFSKTNTCRCGFDGEGVHQCHAGRDLGPGKRCPNEAQPFLQAVPSGLAGSQLKVGAIVVAYCATCREEAGFGGVT